MRLVTIVVVVLIVVLIFCFPWNKKEDKKEGGFHTTAFSKLESKEIVNYIIERVKEYMYENGGLKKYYKTKFIEKRAEISKEIYKLFEDQAIMDTGKGKDMLWILPSLTEAMVYYRFGREKPSFKIIRRLGSGSYNVILLCEIGGEQKVLRIYKSDKNLALAYPGFNRLNEESKEAKSARETLKEISEIFKGHDCVLVPEYISESIDHTSNAYEMETCWSISRLMEDIDISTMINFNNFKAYALAMQEVAILAHKNGYYVFDWKLENSMKYPDENKYALTDIDFFSKDGTVSLIRENNLLVSTHMSPWRVAAEDGRLKSWVLDDRLLTKIDNWTLIKDLISIAESKASSDRYSDYKWDSEIPRPNTPPALAGIQETTDMNDIVHYLNNAMDFVSVTDEELETYIDTILKYYEKH